MRLASDVMLVMLIFYFRKVLIKWQLVNIIMYSNTSVFHRNDIANLHGGKE